MTMNGKWLVVLLCIGHCMCGHREGLADVSEEDGESDRSMIVGGNPWEGVPYDGESGIYLSRSYESVSVTIETEQLLLRPVTWNDYSDYVALLGNPTMMEGYGRGLPWSEEQVQQSMRQWIWKWEEGADPYSAFTAFVKKGEDVEFVGVVILGAGQQKAEAELTFFIREEMWDSGYAKQAVTVVVQDYATFLHELNYYVNLNHPSILAAPLRAIHAIVRADNPYAKCVLESAQMQETDQEIIGGVFCHHYSVTIETLIALEEKRYGDDRTTLSEEQEEIFPDYADFPFHFEQISNRSKRSSAYTLGMHPAKR